MFWCCYFAWSLRNPLQMGIFFFDTWLPIIISFFHFSPPLSSSGCGICVLSAPFFKQPIPFSLRLLAWPLFPPYICASFPCPLSSPVVDFLTKLFPSNRPFWKTIFTISPAWHWCVATIFVFYPIYYFPFFVFWLLFCSVPSRRITQVGGSRLHTQILSSHSTPPDCYRILLIFSSFDLRLTSVRPSRFFLWSSFLLDFHPKTWVYSYLKKNFLKFFFQTYLGCPLSDSFSTPFYLLKSFLCKVGVLALLYPLTYVISAFLTPCFLRKAKLFRSLF